MRKFEAQGSPAEDNESAAKAKEISDLLHLYNNRPFLMENFTLVVINFFMPINMVVYVITYSSFVYTIWYCFSDVGEKSKII